MKTNYLGPLYTPNEIIRLVVALPCPVCKSELDHNIQTDQLDGIVNSYTACLDIDDHYDITFEYEDPKKILMTTQQIDIIEESIQYAITFWRGLKKKDVHTEIEVSDLDTCERVRLDFPNEQIFNFKRYNRKKWITEIKTMLLLG